MDTAARTRRLTGALALVAAGLGAVLGPALGPVADALPGALPGARSHAQPAAAAERMTTVVEATTPEGAHVSTTRTVEDVTGSAARVVTSSTAPTASATAAGAAAASTATYAFGSSNSRGPAHWNRCASIRYWVNPAGMPAGALADVHAAFSRLAASSGLRFGYAGATRIVPLRTGWLSTVPAANRSDIYLAWSDATVLPALAGSVAGLGGATSLTASGREPRLVLGGVVVDRAATLPAGFGPGVTRGALLVHELGHAVNLAHVADPAQSMYPSITPGSRAEYRVGDRAGLTRLKALPCF